MSLQRVRAIAKKEFKHLFRDVRMMAILLLFPAFLLVIFGYAVNFDVKHIKIAVYDNERSELSREFVDQLISSEYFKLIGYIKSADEIKTILDEKIAQCVLVIPNDLSRKYFSKQTVAMQFLVDGVDGNTASIIQNYSNAAVSAFNEKLTIQLLERAGMNKYTPIDLEPQFWFNPDLQTTRFLLPGLIAMILVITAVVSVSLSLVKEKEKGTIEQINVSPIKTSELLIGKTLPYIVMSLANAFLILLVGYILFDVVVKGSLIMLFLMTLLFIFSATSMGIFVSAVADSQQIAFTIATFLSLLPSVILSGFIFPIESMPVAVQVMTNLTPAKFFIVILRAIILRGVGITAFWQQVVYLLIYAFAFLTAADLIFAKKEKSA